MVLDSGALSALAGRSVRARRLLRYVEQHDGLVVVPAPVLAECTTGDGGRDATMNRVMRKLLPAREAEPTTDAVARAAGALRHRARRGRAVDAIVAAEAVRQTGRTLVLTADPDDLGALLDGIEDVGVRRV